MLEPVKDDEVVLEQVSSETVPEGKVELEPTAAVPSEAEIAGENDNNNNDKGRIDRIGRNLT